MTNVEIFSRFIFRILLLFYDSPRVKSAYTLVCFSRAVILELHSICSNKHTNQFINHCYKSLMNLADSPSRRVFENSNLSYRITAQQYC